MLGLGQVLADMQTVPSLYIFALKMSVVRNQDNFQTNSLIHSIDTAHMNQLHLLSVKFPSIQKSVTYSSVKIFNKLPQTNQNFKQIQLLLCVH